MSLFGTISGPTLTGDYIEAALVWTAPTPDVECFIGRGPPTNGGTSWSCLLGWDRHYGPGFTTSAYALPNGTSIDLVLRAYHTGGFTPFESVVYAGLFDFQDTALQGLFYLLTPAAAVPDPYTADIHAAVIQTQRNAA